MTVHRIREWLIDKIKVDSLTSSQMPQCENGGLLIQVGQIDGNGQWSQPETQSSQRLCPVQMELTERME